MRLAQLLAADPGMDRIVSILDGLRNALVAVLVTLSVVALTYAGVRYVIAGGDATGVEKAIGCCRRLENLGFPSGDSRYLVEVSPWMGFLSLDSFTARASHAARPSPTSLARQGQPVMRRSVAPREALVFLVIGMVIVAIAWIAYER